MAGRHAAHLPGEPTLSALLRVELPLSLEAQGRGPRGGSQGCGWTGLDLEPRAPWSPGWGRPADRHSSVSSAREQDHTSGRAGGRVQWLKLHTSTAGCVCLIPGWETKSPGLGTEHLPGALCSGTGSPASV